MSKEVYSTDTMDDDASDPELTKIASSMTHVEKETSYKWRYTGSAVVALTLLFFIVMGDCDDRQRSYSENEVFVRRGRHLGQDQIIPLDNDDAFGDDDDEEEWTLVDLFNWMWEPSYEDDDNAAPEEIADALQSEWEDEVTSEAVADFPDDEYTDKDEDDKLWIHEEYDDYDDDGIFHIDYKEDEVIMWVEYEDEELLNDQEKEEDKTIVKDSVITELEEEIKAGTEQSVFRMKGEPTAAVVTEQEEGGN
mmetsp:Transcript_3541/g.4396  ORF Transcript_3541/g.4396 Transcript_3541/m.4396 type:complete len:250 (-) Transcript_3541:375-1124(-)